MLYIFLVLTWFISYPFLGCSECDDSFEDLDTLSESDAGEFWEEENEDEQVTNDDLPSLIVLWEDVKWGLQITRDAWASWAHMNK